ncbi:YjhX family toxin [Chitinophaga nivalis]|uniref:YjhX family toxin n=1 Tax=Chitinophaga nivalis TaxID=2991709 RepID=A0ABT3IK78_9BACT|nr:YjhX family toxin [Chitinophaga nivalis]MCW3465939.1 YjhX family toxin [Chitinophaga nivalis]MCW3484370.1 YjhX family toxin [Chitinophaga nivalis]
MNNIKKKDRKVTNISKTERRVLEALSRGGRVISYKDERGKIVEVLCLSAEGNHLDKCDLELFKRLKTKRLIMSIDGGPYNITRAGNDAL